MVNTLYSLAFWRDATERALKTAAQSAVIALGGDAFNVWAVDWAGVSGVSLGGAVLSVLTSVASAGIANRGTASLTKAVEPAP